TTSNTSAQASANLPITMTVTPNSGSAPVAVTISGSGNLYYGNLKLDFGDGNETPIYGNSISSDQYGNNQVLHSSHTYTSPGTYTIQLLGQECAGAPSPTCGSFSAIGTVTITVQSIWSRPFPMF